LASLWALSDRLPSDFFINEEISTMTTIKKVILASMVSTMASAFTTSAYAAEFTYDSVLPIYLKLDASLMPEDIVDSYMEKYRPEVWKKYRHDEFELEEKRVETLGLMKDVISAANTDEVFKIQTRMDFGDYNFDNQKFDFRPFNDGLFFPLDNCCNDLPSKIRVSFTNTNIVDGIPMSKDQAKAFLNARKSSGGYIDRTVLAK
jgi:hypothetical protein